MSKVQTETLTIKKVIKEAYLFSVESYQRPYVWGHDEIKKLFDDIYLASKAVSAQNYFIGTTLSAHDNGRYELVDGQQRTTTLILFVLALHELSIKHDITQLLANSEPRIYFPIRDNVNGLLAHKSGLEPLPQTYVKDDYSQGIEEGIAICKGWIQSLGEDQAEFLNYLNTKVCWVNNVLPNGSDLNKIFRIANFSGVQLEQHEILKARLLANVEGIHNKKLFAAIWEACQKMDEYFIKNVREIFNVAKIKDIKVYQKYDPEFFQLEVNEPSNAQNIGVCDLLSLIELSLPNTERQSHSDEKRDQKTHLTDTDTEQNNLRSIISFSQLLLHAYRIFLHNHQKEDISHLNEEKLNEVFHDLTSVSSDELMSFIRLLWRVRYCFDRFVIKRIKDDNIQSEYHDVLMIKKLGFSHEGYFQASITATTALAQLQSILFYTMSRKAQYWLTPFLSYMIQNVDNGMDETGHEALHVLENIDNKLSELRVDALKETTLLELSYLCLKPDIAMLNEITSLIEIVLNRSSGTSFQHYWFYKVEYLLWKQYKDKHIFDVMTSEEKLKFDRFRIVSKNSVEHVLSQKDEYGQTMTQEDVDIDMFGNLVLLSVGENSSYSNQDVGKKMIDFQKKSIYDSLKLKAIYEIFHKHGGMWTEHCIKEHQQNMIQLIKQHYAPIESIG